MSERPVFTRISREVVASLVNAGGQVLKEKENLGNERQWRKRVVYIYESWSSGSLLRASFTYNRVCICPVSAFRAQRSVLSWSTRRSAVVDAIISTFSVDEWLSAGGRGQSSVPSEVPSLSTRGSTFVGAVIRPGHHLPFLK